MVMSEYEMGSGFSETHSICTGMKWCETEMPASVLRHRAGEDSLEPDQNQQSLCYTARSKPLSRQEMWTRAENQFIPEKVSGDKQCANSDYLL